MEYTREDLIEICLNAVVPASKWSNRDSWCAQSNVADIYQALTSGVNYTYYIDGETIWLHFDEIANDEQRKQMSYLGIDDDDDYYAHMEENDPDYDRYSDEMFTPNPNSITHETFHGYLPTRERLEKADGDDWY